MRKCLLFAGVVSLSAGAAVAGDRSASIRPVVVSPDLTAPWVLQLQGRAQPVVYSGRQIGYTVRPVVTPSQQAGLYQPPAPAIQRRGFFQPREAQPAAMVRPQIPTVRSSMDPRFLPQIVDYQTKEPPGSIIIDTNNRLLYLVEASGKARRYGIGVGKPGFEWRGSHSITRKQEWPDWTPPSRMVFREAEKGHYLPTHMQGGIENPLGARAIYLGSTLYRIHGTNAPWTIGYAVSSGCIRMRNEDVTDLYERVRIGTRVVVM